MLFKLNTNLEPLDKEYWEKDVEVAAARQEKSGRPQRRSMDVVKEEMKTVGVTGEDARDDPAWRTVKGSGRRKEEKQKKVVSGLLCHEEAEVA